MPTEEENIQYLYLVLTHAGPPQINWVPVSTALSLSAGATSKRWSRLRTALETGKPAGKGAYELLWLCVKHSARDKALDWKAIAAACGTTPGAASKRYSRMKAGWEKEAPSAAGPPATPGKTPAASSAANTPTPKRKRGPAKLKPKSMEKGKGSADYKYQPEVSSQDEQEEETPKKRARARKIKPDPDADADAEALPTPTPSSSQHQGQNQNKKLDSVFQGFAADRQHAFDGFSEKQNRLPSQAQFQGFRGFRDQGDGEAGEAGNGDGEEWYESSEYLDGGVNER